VIKVLFLAYPGYVDFEIGHSLFFLRKLGGAKVITATLDGGAVESIGGLVTQAQIVLSQADPRDYDLVLISGGDEVAQMINNVQVSEFLQKSNELQKPIAAMCASSTLLGKAGLLKGHHFTCTKSTYDRFKDVFVGAEYTGSPIEVVDNLITAQGTAFAEFTLAVIDQLDLWKNQNQREGVWKFCKGEV
jgi:putative intracellular protease/amidase